MVHSSERAQVLRVFISESDIENGKSLYEQIIVKARELNMASATVVRGIMSFGANGHVHVAKLLRPSKDLPIVIEIVDTPKNIDNLLPFLDEHVKEGLITLKDVYVTKYRRSQMAK